MGFKYQVCETGCSQHTGTTASNEHHAPKKTPPTPKVVIGQEPPIPAWFLHPKTPTDPSQHLQAALFQWLWFLSTWDTYTRTRHMTIDILIKFGRADTLILRSSSVPTKKVLPHRAGMNTDRNLNIQVQKINMLTGKTQLQSYVNHSH